MSRGGEDEARMRHPILAPLEGVSSSGFDGLRARPLNRDTHAAPVPHGDRDVSRWGRTGSRDPSKGAYLVWCERHGAPVGIAVWLVVLAAVGFALPLSRATASPESRAACAALLCVSLVAMALVNQLDPGIIQPSATDDPIIEHLDALARARRDAGTSDSTETLFPGGVRADPFTGHYSRMVSEGAGQVTGGRYGGGDIETASSRERVARGNFRGDDGDIHRSSRDVEDTGVVSESNERDASWDWSRCERYCRTCRVWRPPRAAHCRDCGWCVERFDHHCGALGNCVGRGNHRWFVVFLCSVSCLACAFLVETARALRDADWPRAENSWSDPGVVALVACVIAYGCCACLSCFAVSHVYLFLCDVTTKELLRPKPGRAARERGASDADGGSARRPFRSLRGGLDVGEHGMRRCLKHFVDTALCAGCQLKSRVEKRFEARLESRRR